MAEQFSTPSGAKGILYPADGPTLIIWPGMGISASKFRRAAEQFQQRGLYTVTADYPGQPKGIDRNTAISYPDLADSMAEVAAEMRRRRPGQAVYFVSHSMGGQLSAVLESARPGVFDGLALAASGTNHWRRFPLSLLPTLLFVPTFLEVQARLKGYLDGTRAGFGIQSKQTIIDWARMARTGSWGKHERSTREFPLLALSFPGDNFAPDRAVDGLVAEFPGARVTRKRLDEPRGHVGWIKHPSPVVDEVCGWLDRIAVTGRA
ncbi:MAG: alpha/beta fold hydrolase [Nocardiaceae bacterium]|nr:alpha/beta fold hydrolase [Nocardiaceae bacterium]